MNRQKIYLGMTLAGLVGMLGTCGVTYYRYMTAEDRISQETEKAIELEKALDSKSQTPRQVLQHLTEYQQMENELEVLLKLPDVQQEKAEISNIYDSNLDIAFYGVISSAVIALGGLMLMARDGGRARANIMEAALKK